MDSAVRSIGPGLRAGATVIFETTLPVGDTRSRYTPQLEAASGLKAEQDVYIAFSPERLFSGAVFRNLATYPKLVGGVGPASTDRAASFYAGVLDAEVVAMSSSEAAELSKLADTTYRFVNIAYANQLADFAQGHGLDVQEVIRAANSQPYSHVHQPGLGAGGHCIPVYPHFLLSQDTGFDLVAMAAKVNDGRVPLAIQMIAAELGGLEGVPVLVLGLTYRAGVKETAYSVAGPLIKGLEGEGALVSAWDSLMDPDEVVHFGARPWEWGRPSDARAIVIQTADPVFRDIDMGWFPDLAVVFDGRNALQHVSLPKHVRLLGVGTQPLGRGHGTTARRGEPVAEP
jgi:UDP-N-acetyl-D-mannosaminuronic acid dehydrogenase